MCGIFGLIAKENSSFSPSVLRDMLFKVAEYSQIRGKDSSGLAIRDAAANKIIVLKGPLPVSALLKNEIVENEINKYFKTNVGDKNNNSFCIIGHSRLTTNGTQLKDINNQPVIKDGFVAIHNGIIVNDKELWEKNSDFKKNYDIDTEVMLALLRKNIILSCSLKKAVVSTVKEIFGTVSSAILFNDRDEIVLTTNNGSLYVLEEKELLVFASELFILKKLVKNSAIKNLVTEIKLYQLPANTGLIINLKPFQKIKFNFNKTAGEEYKSDLREDKLDILEYQIKSEIKQRSAIVDMSSIIINPKAAYERGLLENNSEKIEKLIRCTKCLLPETFPFIEYDEKGVCNICNNYINKNHPKPKEQFENLVAPYRGKNGETDCIIPISGGRDSTFTLHYVKNVLKLNPLAFTYDWGMVTDLARRNIARVCGQLGIENIIVSANISQKREFIRKNILAWLMKPDIGMIPLFMAGDKYFYYFTKKLKEQTGIKLNIWGINSLENTDFKVGFSGIKPKFKKKTNYSLLLSDKLKLFKHIGKSIIQNPAYLNSSVYDSIGSFISRYLYPQEHYVHFFDFYKWDEKEIEDVIINQYKWESAPDTKTTWRIGDGTAGFYNYIYYTVTGFTEHDTFRSNQIREGMITRKQAHENVIEENRPRYEAIKWYCEIVGLDFIDTIKTINKIPKLYKDL